MMLSIAVFDVHACYKETRFDNYRDHQSSSFSQYDKFGAPAGFERLLP